MENLKRDNEKKLKRSLSPSKLTAKGELKHEKGGKKGKKDLKEKDIIIGPVLPASIIGPVSPSILSKTDVGSGQKSSFIGPSLPAAQSIIGPVMPNKIINNDRSLSGAASQNRSFTPMTKEEWEKRQSVIRKVYDEDTGRERLVRGDGEIIEEIVSKNRQKEINRQATLGDGSSFQSALSTVMKNKHL